MSHIIGFRIDGLVGRKKPLNLKLNRDDNIIFGHNGCGKTSLLKILHSAMSNETSLLHRVPFVKAEVDIYSMNYDKVFTRSITKPKSTQRVRRRVAKRRLSYEIQGQNEFMFSETSEAEELEWSCSPDKPKDAMSTRWLHEYLPTTRLHVSDEQFMPRYPTRAGSLLTEDELDAFFAQSVESLWSRYSAEILTAVRTAQEKGLGSILSAVLSTKGKSRKRKSKLTSDTAYERVKNFLTRQGSASILGTPADFNKRYREDSTLQDVVQDIDSVEVKIEKAMSSRNRLQELITRMFTGNKTISFTDKSIVVQTPNGEKIGLGSLSSGEKHLLQILVQALLVGESSLLIDEPEISMHVDWQKDLIQCMRALNPNAQFIFATHSPEVMANISDDKIFSL